MSDPASHPAIREPVALDDGLKRLLLDLESKLGEVDLFTLLGVPIEADAAVVKARFYELSKQLHPDRHFRKQLGSFRARLETIFKELSKAHQTLTDPQRRAAYLEANPTVRKPPPEPTRTPMQRMTWRKEDLQLPPLPKPGK